jgi:hypothetical protein
MTKEFVPYKQALEMKDIEFDEPCFGYYNMVNHSGEFKFDTRIWEYSDDYIDAPTYSQAFRFFREKHGLFISFVRFRNSVVIDMPDTFSKVYEIWIQDENEDESIWVGGFDTYEEAELACLNKLIEIVKNK